jgi:hypothetical protein
MVMGRRASKGLLTAILVSYQLYRLLANDGIPDDPAPVRSKTLAVYVIGAKYDQAKRNAPCIIFIDEIDAIGGKRMNEGSSADREIQRTLMELLN